MMKQIGSVLTGLLVTAIFAGNAHAFSVFKGDIKAEFFVGNYVGAPLLAVTDTFYDTSIVRYSCSWNVKVGGEKSVGNVSCFANAPTVSGDDDESLEIGAVFDLNNLTEAAINFDYSGDTAFTEVAPILRTFVGTHPIQDPANNSIIYSMSAAKEAVMGFVGQEVVSKILSAEMGIEVTRPVETVRLDVYQGMITATLELKYNTPDFSSSVYLGEVLDITDKASIDSAALKAGIASAIQSYNTNN